MIGPTGLQTDTGSVIKPQASAFRLFLWHFQTLLSPDSFHSFMVYMPSRVFQQRRDPAIPIAAILTRQLDDGRSQRRFIIRQLALIPLGGPGLPQHPTDAAFRQAQRHAAVLDGLPSARWA